MAFACVHAVVARMRAELAPLGNAVHAAGAKKYFGEAFLCYGIPGAKGKVARVVARTLTVEPQGGDWEFVECLAGELLQSRVYEEGQAAILAIQCVRRSWPDGACRVFERWLVDSIDNWAICDSLCIGVIAPFLASRPEQQQVVHRWAASRHLWLRRAGCVTLTKLCRGLGASAKSEVARMLDGFVRRREQVDIIWKGYGWLLKECASTVDLHFVEDLIVCHGAALPRITVIHATERMPRVVRDRLRAQHAAVARKAGPNRAIS